MSAISSVDHRSKSLKPRPASPRGRPALAGGQCAEPLLDSGGESLDHVRVVDHIAWLWGRGVLHVPGLERADVVEVDNEAAKAIDSPTRTGGLSDSSEDIQ